MQSFKQWLIQEDGYVYFRPSIKIKLGGEFIDISLIDLQTQTLPKETRPKGNLSIKTDSGWINAVLRKGTGLSFYDFESMTDFPKYQVVNNWENKGLIIGKNNERFDKNIDTNVAV